MLRAKRACDERTGTNEPLVYELSCQGHRSVAMFGSDKRWKHISAKQASRLGIAVITRQDPL